MSTAAVQQIVTDNILTAQQRAVELWQADQQASTTSKTAAKKLGEALNKVVELMSHGSFEPWLNENGIKRARATYCMRVATGKVAAAMEKKRAAPKVVVIENGMLIRFGGQVFSVTESGLSSNGDTLCVELDVVRVVEEPTPEPTPASEPTPEPVADDGVSIVFDTDVLKEALAKLKAVVGQKSQEALYQHLRIFTDSEGVNLQGIGIDTTMTLKVPTLVRCDIDRLVVFADLKKMIERLDTKRGSLSFDEGRVSVSSGRFKASLLTFESAVFTALPVVAGINEKPEIGGYTFDLPKLQAQIKQVDFTVPPAEGRHIVGSALLKSDGTNLNIVGTDGYVIAISTTPSDIGEFSFTVPKPALEILKKLDGGPAVVISDTEGAFFFETETELVTHDKTYATFPNYRPIVDGTRNHERAVTFSDKDALVKMLERLKPLCDNYYYARKERDVVLESEGSNSVKLTAYHEGGWRTDGNGAVHPREVVELFTDSLPALVHAPLKVRFDVLKLLPFLKLAAYPVTTYFGGAEKVLDFHAGDGLRFLLMLMSPIVLASESEAATNAVSSRFPDDEPNFATVSA
jgi:DNA polymerase III sliding clamp (beta) subunit (PCNA family)